MTLRRGDDLRPALVGSLALHLGLALICLAVLEFSPEPKLVNVTAVTLVTSAAEPNVRPALQAPQTQTAQSPAPEPSPAPPLPVEAPAPAPAIPPPPPPPAAQPRPAPRPHQAPVLKPKLAPAPKAPPQPSPDLDLTALSKTQSKAAKSPLDLSSLAKTKAHSTRPNPADLDLAALTDQAPGGHRGSAATKGATRLELDRLARPAVGAATALTGDQLGALIAKLNRLWNPNCGVEGAQGVVIKVEMKLDGGLNLIGAPRVLERTSSGASADVIAASAQRALTAVARGSPYTELPKSAPKDIVLTFNAKQACAQQ